VAACDLNEEPDDERGDTAIPAIAAAWISICRKRSSRPSPRRPRIVSLRPPNKDESAESGHDRERDDAAPETASDPQGDGHDDAQRERERRQEPP
jgi:hypothetical protein